MTPDDYEIRKLEIADELVSPVLCVTFSDTV